MRGEIASLNHKVFMLEFIPNDAGSAAVNAAQVRCSDLDAANRVLRAQLAAATALVEQYRVAPQVALRPAPPLPTPCGLAVTSVTPRYIRALLRGVPLFCFATPFLGSPMSFILPIPSISGMGLARHCLI